MRYKLFYLYLIVLSVCATNVYAQDSIDTLAIISFNDFHGKFLPDKEVPGAAALVGTVNALRNSVHHSIVVSGGDNFSGDFVSRITRAGLLKQMFDKMDVELSAVGNHEFDWGKPYLIDTLALIVPLVSSNIINDKGQSPSWLVPYKIVERTLRDGKTFRIAFIGLTTVESATKNRAENLAGFHFTDPVKAVEQQLSSRLSKEGNIDLIVLVMHIGTDMACPFRITEKNSEKLPFIPKIAAIVSAHSHKMVLDKINNVPIIQAGCFGQDIAALYFQIRNHNGIRDISFIKGDTLKVDRKLIDKGAQKAIDEEAHKFGFYDKLTVSKDLLIHDVDVNYLQYTAPGSYIAASYAAAYRKAHPKEKCPVIGVNHFRGIRSSIQKGDVDFLEAANLLPFGGDVVAYRFTGKTLAELLTRGRNNSHGYLQTADIKIQIDKNNRVTHIWQQGKKIAPNDNCIVVADSYIAPGYDGYDKTWFTSPIEKEGTTTFIFTSYLRTLPYISQQNAPVPTVIQ
jgi:5'-nucleotidase/UDP-sugar diphosphatase